MDAHPLEIFDAARIRAANAALWSAPGPMIILSPSATTSHPAPAPTAHAAAQPLAALAPNHIPQPPHPIPELANALPPAKR
jgi:hypothetical protein